MYSCHLFLIFSVSVRSIPFLSFIVPIFTWNIPLVSLWTLSISFFTRRSLTHLEFSHAWGQRPSLISFQIGIYYLRTTSHKVGFDPVMFLYTWVNFWTFYPIQLVNCLFTQSITLVFFLLLLLFTILYLFLAICLAVPGLICCMWTFSCGMWDLVPWPGWNLGPLHWKQSQPLDHQESPYVVLITETL